MRHLNTFRSFEIISESVDLTIRDIDKYRPMFKLMSDLIDLHSDPNYKVNDNSEPYVLIYDILREFESCFNNRFVRIGDKKWSLAADTDDNELRKLKELRKIYIGHGDIIKFDPDLYFEDIKMIDWMLYQVEDGNYHIVIDPSALLGRADGSIANRFRKNLDMLELFYTKFGKLNKPKFTIEDVEDLLLEFLDSRQISTQYMSDIVWLDYRFNDFNVSGSEKIRHLKETEVGNTLFYNINVSLNLPDGDSSERTKIISRLNDSIKSRLERSFKIIHTQKYPANINPENYNWESTVTYRAIEK